MNSKILAHGHQTNCLECRANIVPLYAGYSIFRNRHTSSIKVELLYNKERKWKIIPTVIFKSDIQKNQEQQNYHLNETKHSLCYQ